jgi:hypothetical protein
MTSTDTVEVPAVDHYDRPPLRPPTTSAPPLPRTRPAVPRTSRVVLRRVDPWSVLKLSLLFYVSTCLVLVIAGTLLWVAATSVGIVDGIQEFMDSIGFVDFRFRAGQILQGATLAGLVLAVAGTFANVLMAVLYNLIAEVVGGLKITLAEDATAHRI